MLTAATFGIGRIKGVKRPALTLILPGLGGHKTVFLDTGANADVRPEVWCNLHKWVRLLPMHRLELKTQP